jgi:taurine dioxygenase
VEIASWFGPPVDDHRTGDYWMLLHNDKSAGRDKLPFHSDFTWTDVPVKRISLHALELPPEGTTTSFVSGIHGWATLPQKLQERLSPMIVRHRHFAGYYGQEPIEFLADHPVRFAHPRTGRPILFITEFHAHHVHGMEPKESEKILADLRAHLYTPDQVYEHQWKRHDLLIWDNLAVQHARKAEARPADGPRIMQRVAINETPFIDLVARAGAR